MGLQCVARHAGLNDPLGHLQVVHLAGHDIRRGVDVHHVLHLVLPSGGMEHRAGDVTVHDLLEAGAERVQEGVLNGVHHAELLSSLEGLDQQAAKALEGIVFSRCNLRTNLYRTTRANVETAFRGEIRVFKTAIPDTVKVGDAISRGLTVMEYAPESKASSAYRAFAKEVLASETERAPAEGCTIHVLSDSGVRRVG